MTEHPALTLHRAHLRQALAGSTHAQRACFAGACARRVIEVLADYDRAPKDNAKSAMTLVESCVRTGELENEARIVLDGLHADGQRSLEDLELPVTYALRTVIAALLCAMRGRPEDAEDAANAALDTAGSTDDGAAPHGEESAWQELALRALQGLATLDVEALARLGALPPRWLLRFEGNE